MSWKRVADVAAVVGTYKKDGQDKQRYLNCGVMLKSDDGKCCIKLSCLPFKEDGTVASFLGVYPLKEKEEPKPAPKQSEEFDDSIPF